MSQKNEDHEYIKDNIYRDLLEFEKQFGEISLVVVYKNGKTKNFPNMVDAVESLKIDGGKIQVIKEDTNVLLYEAEVEVDY